jgi:hypothetical protein
MDSPPLDLLFSIETVVRKREDVVRQGSSEDLVTPSVGVWIEGVHPEIRLVEKAILREGLGDAEPRSLAASLTSS